MDMRISRRRLMQWGAGSGLGAFASSVLARRALAERVAAIPAGQAPPSVSPPAARGERSTARACILLYMAGGPSHIDAFDPKPGRPTGGEFKALASAVPGIQL